MFPRKIKGIELQNVTLQKSQTSGKMNKSDFACGKFYRNLPSLPKRLVWFCFLSFYLLALACKCSGRSQF